jgi:hypothetical protein
MDVDTGGPKTCGSCGSGSGSPTLEKRPTNTRPAAGGLPLIFLLVLLLTAGGGGGCQGEVTPTPSPSTPPNSTALQEVLASRPGVPFLRIKLYKTNVLDSKTFSQGSAFLKVHKHEIILNFFLPESNPYTPLVNFRKRFRFFSFDFRKNFEVR